MKYARFLAFVAAVSFAAFPSTRLRAQATTLTRPTSPQLVILDTDIGDDIDDAFALALVLRSPELHLLGVETAFGDTELRARLVDRYLAALGRADIPVLAGIKTQTTHFTQAPYAQQWPAHLHADAVEFLLSQIQSHPAEITLIAIGPLFNIQAAIEKDPVTFRKLKRVVLMGGSIHTGYIDRKNGNAQTPPSPEWNIRCDPAGARALLASGVPVFMMPLDSTQIPLEQVQQARIFSHGSPLTDQLTLLYHQWSGPGEWKTPTLFDPVAVTYSIRPDLCPAEPMHLDVDDQGLTKATPGAPNAQVCMHSDEKAFLDLLVSRITAEP